MVAASAGPHASSAAASWVSEHSTAASGDELAFRDEKRQALETPAAVPGLAPRRRGLREPRFSEPIKFIPVTFVIGIIVTLYSIYVFIHCRMMLQLDLEPDFRDRGRERRGYWDLLAVHLFTIPLVISYVRSIVVHPGEIPDTQEWVYIAQEPTGKDEGGPLNQMEKKRTGDRRYCKWCVKFKPDRSHHCRACRTCILKMDHHCPWIYNCVGFHNHKYFFLLLFYTACDCHLIAWTSMESVSLSVEVETSFRVMFLLLFGSTLASFLGVLVTAFFSFHIWLATRAITTIEFCEKSLKRINYDNSVYDEGLWANTKAVLGPNLLFMLLPFSPPAGDGLTYTTESSYLARNAETDRGIAQVDRRRQRGQKKRRDPAPGSAETSYQKTRDRRPGSSGSSDSPAAKLGHAEP